MEVTILNKYNIFLRRRGLSDKTINDYYLWHAKKFFDYTNAKISDFGEKRKFQARYDYIIMKDSLCNESKKKHLKCARIFADFLLEEELICENAPRQIKPLKVQTRLPIPVEDNEIENIYFAVQKCWKGFLAYRNKTIIDTFLNTGLRRGELINLKRSEIKKNHIIVLNGKGGKDRIVYISDDFYKVLNDFMKKTDGKSEYVFFSQRSEKISERAMSRIFEKIKEETGLDKVHAHKMRHTYASRVVEKNIHIAILRDQLGHKNIATTSRYIAVRNKHRKEVMQEFSIM